MLDLQFYNFKIFFIHLINTLFCLLIEIVIISFSVCVCVHTHALTHVKARGKFLWGSVFSFHLLGPSESSSG